VQILHLIEVKRGKDSETWVHPEIAIDFAEWLSPEFSSFVIICLPDDLGTSDRTLPRKQMRSRFKVSDKQK
jgi:hypothetical protein